MIKLIFIIMIFAAGLCQAQYTPITFKHETSFDNEIKAIIEDLGLDKDFDVGEDGIEQISFALVDMNGGTPILSGYNYNNFIYPASVYKMYVAAEILHQISLGEYSLQTPYIIRTPNDVDKSKEISRDPRPLLKDGDTVTIEYLLDLMISRSDNSAANCLIDVATRPRINQMIQSFGWFGSEVTRKFLKRKFEDPGYDTIRSTETSALHAAEFLYRIHSGTLINYWVSSQMKSYLSRQLDKSKLATGLPGNVMMYHKTGWWSFWTHDVAIVDDGKVKYIITCFLPIEEDKAIPIMKLLSNKIHNLIKLRNY